MRYMVYLCGAAHHHNQIKTALSYVVLTKGFPYFAFGTVAIDRPGQIPLGGNYTQPRLLLLIAHKEKLEILVSNAF